MRLLVIGLDPATLDPSSRSAARQIEYYEGHDVDIVVAASGSRAHVQLTPHIRVLRAGRFPWLLLFRLRRENRYDAMTVQEPVRCGALTLMMGKRIPFHLQDHSAFFACRPRSVREVVLGCWARFIAHRADRIRTVSQRGKHGLESIGIPSDKIDVVFVPTDVSRFENIVHTASQHSRLLCVARLSPEKGVDILLKAFCCVLDRKTDATLAIVGDGPERAKLEQLAHSLGVAQAVHFVGQQTDLVTFFSDADIYVQPSRFEGWGMAVVEAAAAGVPIVMTDVGCAGEVILNNVSGIVVPPENEQALAGGILGLIFDPARAKQLAQKATRSIRSLPTFEQSVERIRSSLKRAAETVPRVSVWPLFIIALAIRFILFVVIRATVGEKGFELGDSAQYLGLAHSLLGGHGFSLDGIPFFYRTIGYPLFLAGGLAVFRSTSGFILFQIFLASLIPLAILRLGRELQLGKRAMWIAAWMAALEPHLVFYSVTVMTEAVYTLVLLFALIFIFRALQSKRYIDSIRAGIAFGIGLLIKPLLQFFPALLLVMMVPWARRIRWRETLTHALVVLVTVGAVIVPWMLRNEREFGSFSLTSQGSSVALFYLGTSIVSIRDHVSYQDAEAKVRRQFIADTGLPLDDGGIDQSAVRKREAMKYIAQNPLIFLRLLGVNTISFWTSNNYNSFLNYYHLIPPIDHSVLPPTHYLAQGRIGDLLASFWTIFSQPFYFVGVLGRIVWILITALFLYGLFAAYRRIPDRRFQWLFLFALSLYLTMTVWVEGLGIEGRLRFPLMPIEFLYAAYGWYLLRKKKRRDPNARLRLLLFTQRVDQHDTNLATHVRWLKTLACLTKSVTVIAQSVGSHDLPSNVRVLSLGKERGASKLTQFCRLYRYAWRETRDSDSILVLMVPLYVLLIVKIAFVRCIPIYLWYTHKHVSLTLRAAVLFVRRVFSASPESFRLETPKVRFMGHAIDTDFFAPDPSVTRTPGNLVTVGRVTPSKRLDFLIASVDILSRQGKDATLDIIGTSVVPSDRDHEQRLRAQVDNLGLNNRVRFLGGQSEAQVRRAYQTAAVCLNASETGSLDKVVLEAMACGCPVVTSNEAYANIVSAHTFVHAPTPEAFADAIRHELNHPSDPNTLRSIVTSSHDLHHTLSQLVSEMRLAVQ